MKGVKFIKTIDITKRDILWLKDISPFSQKSGLKVTIDKFTLREFIDDMNYSEYFQIKYRHKIELVETIIRKMDEMNATELTIIFQKEQKNEKIK